MSFFAGILLSFNHDPKDYEAPCTPSSSPSRRLPPRRRRSLNALTLPRAQLVAWQILAG